MSTEANQQLGKELSQFLSETFVLYVKTFNFHWNVVGDQFLTMHEMFQLQYEELALAIDEIAEHIRMLEQTPPSSMREFLALSSLEESSTDLTADQMLRELLASHSYLQTRCSVIEKKGEEFGDQATIDLIVARHRAHQKTAWMLRSHLETSPVAQS